MPAVSVAATILNEANDIEGLVTSLMQQTLPPAQVIIVDGGSTDGSWEYLTAAATRYPTLLPIRDLTCSLKHSPGPIARGRNVGITAATSDIVATADCGCIYSPDWLANLTEPIRTNAAEYAVGGSWIDPHLNIPPAHSTLWDVASAPFFGVKLSVDEPTKSCTARSMAFRKSLWQRVGGFPETVFLGEDTIFDANVRATVAPAFAPRAKALYCPHHTFASALRQLVSYSITDGVLGVRPARLMRNLFRCLAEVAGVVILLFAALPLSLIPVAVVLALETYWAFRLDWREIRKAAPHVLAARLLFSLLVPWIVTWNQIAGSITKSNLPNRQNAG
jgi:glycosyltransferase involved in cell wall biosynthesis